MTLFQHYIITRFNLPIFKGELRDGASINNLDSKYLRDRFNIFQRFTYPSIKNQTCQDFKWLVLMDENTPMEFKQILSNLHWEYDNLIPCYFSLDAYRNKVTQDYIDKYNDYAVMAGLALFDNIEYSDFVQRILSPIFIKDEILKYNQPSKYVVTTRIDNDDLFHPEMIKTVQAKISNEQEPCLYNFSYGYQVHLKRRLLQLDFFPHNHYTTLVEDSNDLFQSVLYWDHSVVERFTDYREIKTEPLWVELVHESSVSNCFESSSNHYLMYRNLDNRTFPMLSDFKINYANTFILDIRRKLSRIYHRLK